MELSGDKPTVIWLARTRGNVRADHLYSVKSGKLAALSAR
jgi:hypothetical protein